MIVKNYKVDGMFIGALISGIITATLSILSQNYIYLGLVLAIGIISYSHKPTRLTTKNTEANIG